MKLTPILFLLVLMPCLAWAQEKKWGSLTGGIESNSVLYTDGAFRSNNYLKLDFVKGRFSAGVQAEYYPSPLLGYDANLKGIGLPEKYLTWTDKYWSLTAGDFYDQFGTGIILRSWEDRALGWNNSLGGGRATFKTANNVFSAKVLGGFRRQYLWYSGDALAGAEALFHLGAWDFGGSAVYRMGADEKGLWYEAQVGYAVKGFTVRAEYVGKKGGNAQTLELGYARKKFSSALTLRRLQAMNDAMGMNYLPSLSQEQHYMLASLNPYTTFADGELGGNADVFYRLSSWKFHVSGAYILSLPSALKNHDRCRLAYREINVEVEKRWNRRLKTVAFMSIQENSPTHGERKATNAQNVFVLDGVYKMGKNLSLRAQVQYLYSQELTRDWVAGMLELSSTTGWSVHVQDMYNHGETKDHYYNIGVSWTRRGFKADLSYGHQRAGLVCSGGVCRWQPEYKGGMLRLSYNF